MSIYVPKEESELQVWSLIQIFLNSSPASFYLRNECKINGERNEQSKNQYTVSWKENNQQNGDTGSCCTTATNTRECSIDVNNTCQICKIVLNNLLGGQFVHIVKKLI